MKLGLLSAIFPDLSFEDVIDFVSETGYKGVELMCWPKGKAERRYAGVSHIDVVNLKDEDIKHIKGYCAQRNVEISTLGYYPNPLDGDLEKREIYVEHIRKVITGANKLGIKNVSTFIGRDKTKTIEQNLVMFKEVWPSIIKHAEEQNVVVSIENCPMYFTMDEWPGGVNLASSPHIWREMFKTIVSDNFALSYDPSHLALQRMDYIKPIYEFKDKIYYVHLKDTKVYQDKIDEYGTLVPPGMYHSPKLPGLGDIDWSKFMSALNDTRYNGWANVEIEDKAFEATLEDRKTACKIAYKFLGVYFA